MRGRGAVRPLFRRTISLAERVAVQRASELSDAPGGFGGVHTVETLYFISSTQMRLLSRNDGELAGHTSRSTSRRRPAPAGLAAPAVRPVPFTRVIAISTVIVVVVGYLRGERQELVCSPPYGAHPADHTSC